MRCNLLYSSWRKAHKSSTMATTLTDLFTWHFQVTVKLELCTLLFLERFWTIYFLIFTTVQNVKRYKVTLCVRYLSFHVSWCFLQRKPCHCVLFQSTLRPPWLHTILTWYTASLWQYPAGLRPIIFVDLVTTLCVPSPRVPHTTSRRASGDVLRVPHRPVLTSSQITGCLFDLDSISLHPASIHARVKHPRTVPNYHYYYSVSLSSFRHCKWGISWLNFM